MAKLEITLTDTQLKDVLKLLAGLKPEPVFRRSYTYRIRELLADYPEGLRSKQIVQALGITYQAAYISLRRLTERALVAKQPDNSWILTKQAQSTPDL